MPPCEIRQRLAELIGNDARGVTVLTCHALAMRLAGASFVGRANKLDSDAFELVLQQAVALKGAGSPPEEADQQRDRLLAGFRWILVDEYQDIARANMNSFRRWPAAQRRGRSTAQPVRRRGRRPEIYAFDGASVEFIRRFETDYAAKPAYLTSNYRSSAHIIAAANLIIAPAS